MADKAFGVDQLDILGTGTPTISAPNQLNLDCHTVAISTSTTVGNNITVTGNVIANGNIVGDNSTNISGIASVTATTFYGSGANLSGISAGITTTASNIQATWDVVNNSASAYRFTGPGQDGAEDNPDVYLVRGQRYRFSVNASGHPFQLRVSNGGSAYTDGVTNNGAQSGNVEINVQHDAPARLFYQCSNHGGMVGNIFIIGGSQIINAGVVTFTDVPNPTPSATLPAGTGGHIYSFDGLNLVGRDNIIFQQGGFTRWKIASGHFRPQSDSTVDIGTNTVRVRNGYFDTLDVTDLKLPDGNSNGLYIGGSDDLHLFHNGADSYVENDTGNLNFTNKNNNNIIFKTTNSETERLRIASDGTLTSTASNNGQIIHTFNNTDTTSSSSAMTVEQHFNFNRTGGGLNLSAARIVAGKEREWVGGAANQDGFLAFYTALNETPSEKLRIDSSGTIQVKGDGGNNNKIYGYDGADLAWILGNNNSDDPEFTNFRSGNLKFKTGGTERLRIDSSGRVLINTTSHTNVENGSTNAQYLYQGYKVSSRDSTSNREHLVFYNPNGDVGSINTSGSNTSYTTASDYRLKENETAISDGITRLKTLKPYRFNFKVDKDTTVDGFFAHEVTAVPEAITGTKDEVDSDNKPVYQGIDQSKLVPLLTAALQEAITKIETLEAKVATLEGS